MSPGLFRPGASATLAGGTTSANVALPGSFAGVQVRAVRLYNEGPSAAFVEFGGSGQVATVNSMCVPAGAIEMFGPPGGTTHIAAITSTGTATLRITTGEGA